MKLIVDANILFALAKKESQTAKLVDRCNLKLFSIDYALAELMKYKEEWVKKSGRDIDEIMQALEEKIEFIPVKDCRIEIQECEKMISDANDVVYLALARKLRIPIWSNDPHLKEQSLIPVITTAELIDLLAG